MFGLGLGSGGKMMASFSIISLYHLKHRPIYQEYTSDAQARHLVSELL